MNLMFKKMMLYHEGTLFGKSVDDPNSFAKTVLDAIFCCFKADHHFCLKCFP